MNAEGRGEVRGWPVIPIEEVRSEPRLERRRGNHPRGFL